MSPHRDEDDAFVFLLEQAAFHRDWALVFVVGKVLQTSFDDDLQEGTWFIVLAQTGSNPPVIFRQSQSRFQIV